MYTKISVGIANHKLGFKNLLLRDFGYILVQGWFVRHREDELSDLKPEKREKEKKN